MRTFDTADGYEYTQDQHGVIHQVNPEPFVYDPEYLSTYDKGRYALQSSALSYIRIGVVLEMYGRIFGESPSSILDFGCGNGAFGKHAGEIVERVYGYDVFQHSLPSVMQRVPELRPADVYTFWDSLEHCPDIDFIERLDCSMVAISLPWCHDPDTDWFVNWKHRKPNEHIHHFNCTALVSWMFSKGWTMKHTSNIEDAIRTPVDNQKNILTAIFYKDGRP